MKGTILIDLKNLRKTEPTALDKEIARLFAELANHEMHSDEYDKVSDQLAKLYKLQEVDSKKRVSKDQMVSAATSILSILVIVNYEHAHVLGSKAVSFVGKKLSS